MNTIPLNDIVIHFYISSEAMKCIGSEIIYFALYANQGMYICHYNYYLFRV